MWSKRPPSPVERCDISVPKHMKRQIDMKWRQLPLYQRIATARDQLWDVLYARNLFEGIDRRPVLLIFDCYKDALREDALSNPYKFKIELRKQCPSFPGMPLSGDCIDNLDEVMNNPEVIEWLNRKVQARRNEIRAADLHAKLSRQLFWCSQLGLAAMDLLDFRMESFGQRWKICYDRRLQRYVTCVDCLIHTHWNTIFLDPGEDSKHASVPRITEPVCPPADYFPAHLPRCVVHLANGFHCRDLTPIILYAPILVELLHGVDGFDELIIQRIASFLWPGLVDP